MDDQPDIVELAATVLSGDGYAVATAGNGSDALERLGDEAFDLVLLDINMPGIDGWETLRLIRADPDLQSLPVLMFSVKGELQDKVVALQEGATDYVTKPFEIDVLLAHVKTALESAAAGEGRS